MTRVFIRQSSEGSRYRWRQYLAISDSSVVIVEMTPVAGPMGIGWNVGKITRQGTEDWPDMNRDQIIAWKNHAYPGDMAEVSDHMRERVLGWLGWIAKEKP